MFTLGRHENFAQILSQHESISRQHAAIVYHGTEARWYIVDFRSAHGTRLRGSRLDPFVPYAIKEGDTFTLGTDSRVYKVTEDKEGLGVDERPAKKARTEATAPSKVRCSHILVKHSKSRNPTSWRQQGPITRTKDEAIAQIRTLRAELQAVLASKGTVALGAAVADRAKTLSDCSSAKRGGDLGEFGRGQMQPSFEAAAFALQPGELSDVVDSDSGIHLVWRHL